MINWTGKLSILLLLLILELTMFSVPVIILTLISANVLTSTQLSWFQYTLIEFPVLKWLLNYD